MRGGDGALDDFECNGWRDHVDGRCAVSQAAGDGPAQRRGRRRLPETSDPTATASSKSSSGRSAIGCGLRRWGSHGGGAAAAAAVLVVVVMVVIVASVTISGAIYR